MSVIVLVDMDRGRLAFAVGGGGAIDSGLRLPATARPWVWLGGPGVGTVSVFDCTYTVAQPPPPEPAVAPPVVLDLAAVEESDITSATASKHTRSGPTGADVLDEPGLTLDLNAVEDGALTPARSETTDSDKQTNFSSEAEPIPWTDRAGNWLSGLQQVGMPQCEEPSARWCLQRMRSCGLSTRSAARCASKPHASLTPLPVCCSGYGPLEPGQRGALQCRWGGQRLSDSLRGFTAWHRSGRWLAAGAEVLARSAGAARQGSSVCR